MTGTIIVDELRSVGVKSSKRRSDPANPSVGDRWVRDDVTPTVGSVTAIGVVRIQGPTGTQDWPIIDEDDESALGSDVYPGLRVYWEEFDGQFVVPFRGFVPVTDQSGSLGSPRLVHNGTEYQAHDALTVSAIPDSAIVQYAGENYDGSDTFDEPINNEDLNISGTPSVITTNGDEAVDFEDSEHASLDTNLRNFSKIGVYAVVGDLHTGGGYTSAFRAIATQGDLGQWGLYYDSSNDEYVGYANGSDVRVSTDLTNDEYRLVSLLIGPDDGLRIRENKEQLKSDSQSTDPSGTKTFRLGWDGDSNSDRYLGSGLKGLMIADTDSVNSRDNIESYLSSKYSY